VRFQDLKAVNIKITVFMDVTLKKEAAFQGIASETAVILNS
jgi:hypothetical protein